MAAAVAEFFLVIGVDIIPPTTMAELIPYLLTIVIGVFLVAMVFKVICYMVYGLMNMRRF